MRTHPQFRRSTITAVVAIVIIGVTFSGVAFAQLAPPSSYYGEVTSADGTDAPTGTVIVAVADGSVQDDITVQSAGEYGNPDENEYLRVPSDFDTVTFHIGSADGPQADPPGAVTPESNVTQKDLTFPNGAFDDGGDSTPPEEPTKSLTPEPTTTPDDGSDSTETPTPEPTKTPTDDSEDSPNSSSSSGSESASSSSDGGDSHSTTLASTDETTETAIPGDEQPEANTPDSTDEDDKLTSVNEPTETDGTTTTVAQQQSKTDNPTTATDVPGFTAITGLVAFFAGLLFVRVRR